MKNKVIITCICGKCITPEYRKEIEEMGRELRTWIKAFKPTYEEILVFMDEQYKQREKQHKPSP